MKITIRGTADALWSSLEFHRTTTSCGPILRAEFRACRLEAGIDGSWLHVIDENSELDHFVLRDGEWTDENTSGVTDMWSEDDWAAVISALCTAE